MPKVSSKGKSPSARLFLTPKTTTGTNPPKPQARSLLRLPEGF